MSSKQLAREAAWIGKIMCSKPMTHPKLVYSALQLFILSCVHMSEVLKVVPSVERHASNSVVHLSRTVDIWQKPFNDDRLHEV